MTTHIPHPSTLDYGLVDGCPACEAKQRDPLSSLDAWHLYDLWSRMITVEFLNRGGAYRSRAEAAVCDRLYFAARVMERCGIDPRRAVPGDAYHSAEPCPSCGAQHHETTCPLCGYAARMVTL